MPSVDAPEIGRDQHALQRSIRSVVSHSTNLLLAGVLTGVTLSVFLLTSDQVSHWFLIPVGLCGLVISLDVAAALRGQIDLFDPASLIGVIGFHFFFLAPLLHVAHDYWMVEIANPPPDWRDWIGYMAIVNAGGLLIYRVTRRRMLSSTPTPSVPWSLAPARFWALMVLALVGSAVLQIAVYAQYGGISGFVAAIVNAGDTEAARGMGWLFTLAESFPSLAFVAWMIRMGHRPFMRSWWALAILFALYFGLALFFGGLRGSRANTVWVMLWIVATIHSQVRPLSGKLLFMMGLVLFGFIYFYGLFKAGGIGNLADLTDPLAREELVGRSGRNMDFVVLGDLGRSDVQAFLLYRMTSAGGDYDYAWGRTYLGDAASLVPRAIWPDRPPTKVKWGTELQFGRGMYDPTGWFSTRQYGLVGEIMLNFGLWATPVAFAILGLVVGWVQRWRTLLNRTDVRMIFVPLGAVSGVVMLYTDLDNVLYFLFRTMGVVLLIVLLSRQRASVGRDFQGAA